MPDGTDRLCSSRIALQGVADPSSSPTGGKTRGRRPLVTPESAHGKGSRSSCGPGDRPNRGSPTACHPPSSPSASGRGPLVEEGGRGNEGSPSVCDPRALAAKRRSGVAIPGRAADTASRRCFGLFQAASSSEGGGSSTTSPVSGLMSSDGRRRRYRSKRSWSWRLTSWSNSARRVTLAGRSFG